ncbi:hypothetical protein AB0C65_35550 [Nocardia sp. NPDC048505]|uniref:hypothetical protein n=1 Tax=Nocardia sp. NPDC048505 TaxID=3155756 RepID=UPI0033C17F85
MTVQTPSSTAAHRWREARERVRALLAAPDEQSRWQADRAGKPIRPKRRLRRGGSS